MLLDASMGFVQKILVLHLHKVGILHCGVPMCQWEMFSTLYVAYCPIHNHSSSQRTQSFLMVVIVRLNVRVELICYVFFFNKISKLLIYIIFELFFILGLLYKRYFAKMKYSVEIVLLFTCFKASGGTRNMGLTCYVG